MTDDIAGIWAHAPWYGNDAVEALTCSLGCDEPETCVCRRDATRLLDALTPFVEAYAASFQHIVAATDAARAEAFEEAKTTVTGPCTGCP